MDRSGHRTGRTHVWLLSATGMRAPRRIIHPTPILYQPVALGSAPNLGTRSIAYNFPVVGMASTPDGQGPWLVSSDGGVFVLVALASTA